jgi:methyl-accepting chemotaxis protein
MVPLRRTTSPSQRTLTIRARIILLTSMIVTAIFVGVAVLVITSVMGNNRDISVRYMEALSVANANKAQALLEASALTSRTLATVIEGMLDDATDLQAAHVGALRSVAESDGTIVGAFIVELPDAGVPLDPGAERPVGRRDVFARLVISQAEEAGEGAFVLDSELVMQQPYVQVPLTTGRDFVSEPSALDIAGTSVRAVTVSSPITRDGAGVGVVGVHLDAAVLQRELGSVALYETGFGRLISADGTVVVHPFPDRVGRTAPEWMDENTPDLLASLAAGEIFTDEYLSIATGEITIKSFVPITISTNSAPWVYGTVVNPDEVYAAAYRTLVPMLVVMGVGLAAIIVSIGLLAATLLRPLQSVRDALGEVAQGDADLTQTLEVRSHDEVGSIATHFNTFVSGLAIIMREIRSALGTLNEVGEGLAANMEETGATIRRIGENISDVNGQVGRQADSVRNVSATVEQITGNIDGLNRLIARQSDSLSNSSAAVEEMVASIQSVTQNIDSNMQSFHELEAVSETGYQQLTSVTDSIRDIARQSDGLQEANTTINQIASQTNLLAMNAAIEAAHAGETGRGFAVVADEIRKLAENSAEQSHTIGNALKTLKELIDNVVSAVDESGHSFEAIRESVQTVTAIQSEIRQAMDEQSQGSTTVLGTIEELRRIAHEVESGSGEMAAGSDVILTAIHELVETSRQVAASMEEMARGASEITLAVQSVVDLTARNSDGIRAVESQTSRFIVGT